MCKEWDVIDWDGFLGCGEVYRFRFYVVLIEVYRVYFLVRVVMFFSEWL